MRIYIILFFLVPVILLSCSGNGVPPGILDKEHMVALLTDVHTVDGALSSRAPFPDTLYKYGSRGYEAVFKNHYTDSAQFRKSFTYYSSKPELLDKVYTDVIKNLKHKTDSITKLNLKKPHAVPAK